MSSINFHTKEISVKIVYYGPGLCGKTTTLQTIYKTLPESERPQLVSLATDVDRTIFFDFLPLTAYRIRDFKVRLQLYTVPGQVFYNATRKLVLNGVDGLVFVADSQRAMEDSNMESLQNLQENLSELGLDTTNIPMVMQFNKRDLVDIAELDEMDKQYNHHQVPVFATVATTGDGLFEALKAVSQMVVNDLIRKGLGQQLRDHEEKNKGEKKSETNADAFSAGFSAAVAEDAPAGERAGENLWPAGDLSHLGKAITDAIKAGDWRAAVLAAEKLLEYEVHRWAAHEGRKPNDALSTFLFMRGASSTRYRAYLQDIIAAHANRPVTQAGAINALLLALDALW